MAYTFLKRLFLNTLKVLNVEPRGGKSKHFKNDLKKILDKLNPENQD